MTRGLSKDEESPPAAAPSPTGAGERRREEGEEIEEDAAMRLLATVVASSADGSTAAAPALSAGLPKSAAYALLNLVTVLWGTQHAVIKAGLLAAPDHPGTLNALRFALAALLFLPWTPNPFQREQRDGIWRTGGELGLWMFAGTYTTRTRCCYDDDAILPPTHPPTPPAPYKQGTPFRPSASGPPPPRAAASSSTSTSSSSPSSPGGSWGGSPLSTCGPPR